MPDTTRSQQDFDGRVAIVTGASRGIGAAIARGLARGGARVVLAARKSEGLAPVVQEIHHAGGEATGIACHVGKIEQVEALVSSTVSTYGQVDILINNAGTNVYFGPLMNVEWAAWDKIFEVNLKGAFACARTVARHLMDRKAGGSIVNISSVVALRAAPLQGPYAMTKAALISMTQTLAVELGGTGIRINAVAPGLVETRLSAAIVDNDLLRQRLLDRTALGRVGQPDDIVGAALFLASEASAYVTGHCLVVDGGLTLE